MPSAQWLKNAALYWDVVYTIAPKGAKVRYSEETARRLADVGVLQTLFVDSASPEVESVADVVIKWLATKEAKGILQSGGKKIRLRPKDVS
jgi:hypothetical protein